MLRVERLDPLVEARLDLAEALALAAEVRAELRASALFDSTPVMAEVEDEEASAVLFLPRDRSE